jgi:uncharacterized protein
MLKSTAHVTSARASIHLQQLCKHFAHKLPVAFNPEKGEIRFGLGTCYLAAQAHDLEMRVEADDAGKLAELQDVVARHLVRFAFKEPPDIVWSAEA